eukprot:TRINITY_DN46425_c0_g1_i1.p1 TRINITY_DN46425_c0_g1~~TRINITY_DN46425_c0_g1_i1.p1  ORF type:complete len:658 (+),score=130.75 TRINITY_DN46425_c0_g1_i1:86-2059(+)
MQRRSESWRAGAAPAPADSLRRRASHGDLPAGRGAAAAAGLGGGAPWPSRRRPLDGTHAQPLPPVDPKPRPPAAAAGAAAPPVGRQRRGWSSAPPQPLPPAGPPPALRALGGSDARRRSGSIPSAREILAAHGIAAPAPAPSPPPSPLTPRRAAVRLQCLARRLYAQFRAQDLRQHESRETLERLEHKLWLEQVKTEKRRRDQEERAQREKRERAELQRRREEQMLQAAFDGSVAAIRRLSGEGVAVDVRDVYGNTPLGEAAVSGERGAVRVLLELGADPNEKGFQGRTPLWRAAFNSHTAVCRVLLERGADPRVVCQGELPSEVCNDSLCRALLSTWDTSQVDSLRADTARRVEGQRALCKARQQRAAAAALREAEQAVQEVGDGRVAHGAARRKYESCVRDFEAASHAAARRRPPGGAAAALQQAVGALRLADAALEGARTRVEQAEQRLHDARVALPADMLSALQGATSPSPASGVRPAVRGLPLRALPDTLLRGSLWSSSRADDGPRRWPLLLDPSGQARLFLRYRDTNMLNACHPRSMQGDAPRLAALGALRYGKPFIIDLMDADLVDCVRSAFDSIQPGFFNEVLLHPARLLGPAAAPGWRSLLRDDDPDEYREDNFTAASLERFRFVVACSMREPPSDLGDRMAVYRVDP